MAIRREVARLHSMMVYFLSDGMNRSIVCSLNGWRFTKVNIFASLRLSKTNHRTDRNQSQLLLNVLLQALERGKERKKERNDAEKGERESIPASQGLHELFGPGLCNATKVVYQLFFGHSDALVGYGQRVCVLIRLDAHLR